MVPLNLVDFWQISPEGAKQFRHLSTRKQKPRRRKAVPKARATALEINLVTACPGYSSHNTKLLFWPEVKPKTFRMDAVIGVGPGGPSAMDISRRAVPGTLKAFFKV